MKPLDFKVHASWSQPCEGTIVLVQGERHFWLLLPNAPVAPVALGTGADSSDGGAGDDADARDGGAGDDARPSGEGPGDDVAAAAAGEA